MFVVVGVQRSGTTILREILNTNARIGMLGEIFMPSAAPAHWDNFLQARAGAAGAFASAATLDVLLDRYFEFVRARVQNHWAGGLKARSEVIGVDVKYNQMGRVAPRGWNSSGPPYFLRYLMSRDVTFVHTLRSNVIQCALSAFIATQRNLWHNYAGAVVDRRYYVDVAACLAYARTILKERAAFLEFAAGSRIVSSYYDGLARDIARATPGGAIPEAPGTLRDIARALDVPFQFQYDGRLQRAIDVPYSQVVSNYDELARALERSEFSAFVSALEE